MTIILEVPGFTYSLVREIVDDGGKKRLKPAKVNEMKLSEMPRDEESRFNCILKANRRR